MQKTITSFFIILILTSLSQAAGGKKVFETYCWGCHHQTAEAFGPSFEEISSKKGKQKVSTQIMDTLNAMITDGQIKGIYFTEFVIQ